MYGIDDDEDGDITTVEFDRFTSGMGGEFTPATVRSCEVVRDDPDVGTKDEFAEYLGIDAVREKHLMWIAEQCRVAPLPQGWVEYATEDGDSYFHNAHRGETIWHHPLGRSFFLSFLLFRSCLSIITDWLGCCHRSALQAATENETAGGESQIFNVIVRMNLSESC